MSTKAIADLDLRIQQLEAQSAQIQALLERLRAIRSMLDAEPQLAAELLDILVKPPERPYPPTVLAPKAASKHATINPQFVQIRDYFQANENGWASAGDISEATGLTRNAVNALLNMSKYARFFHFDLVSPRKKFWRLDEDALAAELEPPSRGRLKLAVPPSSAEA